MHGNNPLLDPAARLVIAHRGNRVGAPENTLEAFRQALGLGADALELDVRVTADDRAVVVHDATLDRTTNGHGAVRAFRFGNLRTLDAGARSPHSAGKRHAIPTLEEVLEEFRSTPIVIEVKELEAVDLTRRAVERLDAMRRVVVGSSATGVMERFAGGSIARCASMREAVRLIPTALAGRQPPSPDYQVLSITPRFHGLPIPVVALARTAAKVGVATQVWTVNDPVLASRFWEGGVAGIVTDDPAAILRARAS